MATRSDGRSSDAPRKILIETGTQRFPEGSLIYRSGKTAVLIAASIEDSVPPWMKGKGRGWVTAEYEMHPRSNPERQRRSRSRGNLDGRSSEIQRLIARALRAAVDLGALGERMITVDCDVLDADGGTRTASITGSFVALYDAVNMLLDVDVLPTNPVRDHVAAVSVGVFEGTPVLDLDYAEDSACDTDMNVVMMGSGGLIEVQGTAEGAPFSRAQLDTMLELAGRGIGQLIDLQKQALAQAQA